MKRTVAILPVTLTNWPVLKDLALAIHSAGEFAVVVLVANAAIRARVRAEGLAFPCVDLDTGRELKIAAPGCGTRSIAENVPAGGTGKTSWADSRHARLLQFFPLRGLMTLVKCLQLSLLAARCRGVLKRIAPISLVVPGDRESGYLLPMIREARRLGIPAIVGGGILSASPNEMFPARRERPVYHVTGLSRFKRKYPNQWRHDSLSGQDISVYGAYLTQAYALLGMLPQNPWVIGGGPSDCVMVESERIRDRYVEQGVAASKIRVVGHVNHDRLFRAQSDRDKIRERLIDRHGLERDQPILLFGPSNFGETGIYPWDYHWAACRELAGIAASNSQNVLVTLHPRQARLDYQFLEKEFPPLKILDEPLADILPAVDTYFIGLGSSTESWAIQCGVPVVVADHYSLKVHFNEATPGIVYVQDISELSDILRRVHGDRAYRAEFTNGMVSAARTLGDLDGNAVKRTIEVVCHPPALVM